METELAAVCSSRHPVLLGFDIFMAMLFWWSASFPGWGTIAIYLFSILIVAMWFSIAWPQIVLFE